MNFNESCYSILKNIPKGNVTTYKEIANKLGTKAYRAVGNAMNKNPYPKIPCHRVVKSSGEIGGFARGKKNKIKKLKQEGVEIINSRIDLDKFLFKLN